MKVKKQRTEHIKGKKVMHQEVLIPNKCLGKDQTETNQTFLF